MSTVHRSLPVTPHTRPQGAGKRGAFARSYLRFATLKDFPMNTTPTFRDAAQQAIELRSPVLGAAYDWIVCSSEDRFDCSLSTSPKEVIRNGFIKTPSYRNFS